MDNYGFRAFCLFQLVVMVIVGVFIYLYLKPAKPQIEACKITCSDQCQAACNNMCTRFYIISQESPKD